MLFVKLVGIIFVTSLLDGSDVAQLVQFYFKYFIILFY